MPLANRDIQTCVLEMVKYGNVLFSFFEVGMPFFWLPNFVTYKKQNKQLEHFLL